MHLFATILLTALVLTPTGCSLPRALLLTTTAHDPALAPPAAHRNTYHLDPFPREFPATATTEFLTPYTPADLLDYYRQQLPRHGWRLENGWTTLTDKGELSATATFGIVSGPKDNPTLLLGLRLTLHAAPNTPSPDPTTRLTLKLRQEDLWGVATNYLVYISLGYNNLLLALPLMLTL